VVVIDEDDVPIGVVTSSDLLRVLLPGEESAPTA
jgi:CBS domain-containing protein